MDKNDRIYVAGHRGLIGSAILRRLIKDGYKNIITREHAELDLCDQSQVKAFFEREKPAYVFMAAAKVGGVFANTHYRADFIYENVTMQSNVIHNSFLSEVKKLLFLSSADAYPAGYQNSARESDLLTGPLEPTCEPFAIAKIAGVKMCEAYNRQYGTNFIVVIPPNVYGPHQRYDALKAQVLPSLMKKFHEAKEAGAKSVVIWGTGGPVRDFLFVDDLADGCVFLMNAHTEGGSFNIGTGKGTTILELAETVKKVVGYRGKIIFDRTKPDGVSKKLLDISKIKAMRWKVKTALRDGIKVSYRSFLNELKKKEVRTSRICDIKICEKDVDALKSLSAVSGPFPEGAQPDTYKDKVVIKPWGYEFPVFENKKTAVWLLYLKKGHSTSMHCHPRKKTSLIILSGKAMSNTFSSRNYLRGGDAIIIGKGVFHLTKVLSDDGFYMLEIESPPIKTDLLRLEDRYGREALGYEGVSEMQTENLREYGYFSFAESDHYEKYVHTADRFTVTFEVFPNDRDFQKYFRITENGLYTACRGRLLDGEGKVLLGTADTQKTDTLSTVKKIHIREKTVLLKTTVKDKS